MKKYKGIPTVYDYWSDLDNVYAIVEWPKEEIKENKSNLFLIISERYDYTKNI